MNGTQDAENVISELRSSLEQVVKERYGINILIIQFLSITCHQRKTYANIESVCL